MDRRNFLPSAFFCAVSAQCPITFGDDHFERVFGYSPDMTPFYDRKRKYRKYYIFNNKH